MVGSALSLTALAAQSTLAKEFEQIDLTSSVGQSLILNDARVDYTGSGPAVWVSGAQNQLQGQDYDIRVTADPPYASVVGVQVDTGGKAELSGVTISTAGSDFAIGAHADGADSQLTLNDVQITTSGNRSLGVVASNGAQVLVAGGSISTSGDEAEALYARGTGSRIQASDLTLTATGTGPLNVVRAADGTAIELQRVSVQSSGFLGAVAVEGGGSLTFRNGSINAEGDGITLRDMYRNPGGTAVVSHSRITSQNGHGIYVQTDQATADLDSVQITSLGDHGTAIWMTGRNTRVNVKDSVLQTHGRSAVAIDNRDGVFTMDGGSISTLGDHAHALYATLDSSHSPGAVINVSRVLIETSGNGAVGGRRWYGRGWRLRLRRGGGKHQPEQQPHRHPRRPQPRPARQGPRRQRGTARQRRANRRRAGLRPGHQRQCHGPRPGLDPGHQRQQRPWHRQ
ncbi:hypothetical protein [Pseudomonas sp. Eqa60]|uniref:hypothetical protein n=1 Tax=Pseudomonas sp. Eqa60 TaxID=2799184 RepID=UPI001FD16D3B|nr:hypothetical protein [Pseudomonas sp. Eqa60]